jgi:hypothetical protein
LFAKGSFFSRKVESLVLFCLLAAVACLVSHDFLVQKQENFARTRSHYLLALNSSRSFLDAFMHELIQEQSFQENINSHLANSLQKNLQSMLRKGQLDHLEVLDEQCQSLANVGAKSWLAPLNCSKDGNAGFSVQEAPHENTAPILALVRQESLPSGQKLWLRAQVFLSDNWLHLYPALQEDFSAFSVQLSKAAPEFNYPLASAESTLTGEQSSTLWSSDRFLAFAAAQPHISLLKHGIFWGLITIALAILMAQWFFARSNSWRMRRFWQQFSDRVDSLFASEGLVFHYVPADDPGLRVFPGALQGMQRMQQQIASSQQSLKNLKEENQELLAKIADLTKSEELMKKDLAQMACYEGLALQVRSSTATLLTELAQEADHHSDLIQAVRENLFSTCREIMQLASNWQDELHHSGSRKFIRTLCEQKNADSPFPNLLEEQLAALLNHLQSIVDQGIFLCTSLGSQADKTLEKRQLLQRWYRLSLGSESKSTVTGTQLGELLAETLSLRAKNQEPVRLHCPDLNLCGSITEMPLPPASMAAALHHMLQCLAYALPASTASYELSLRVKEVNGESLFLLSCSTGDLFYDEDRRGEMVSAMARVNLLLAPFPVSFILLPSQHELTVFALKWAQLPAFSHASSLDSHTLPV